LELNNSLSIQDAVKLYRTMRFLNDIEYIDSIKAIYADMNKSGFYFSLCEQHPKEINKNDYDYKWIEVNYKLCLVRRSENNEDYELKQLKKWWTIYCMTRKDISYDDWREENVSINDSNCDVSGILEACNINIDRLNYFQQGTISYDYDAKAYYPVDLIQDRC
jgi:hypothetical protein